VTEETSETLIARLRSQQQSNKLDLSLCDLTRVPIESILAYYGRRPMSLDLSYNIIQYISPRFTFTPEFNQISKLDLSKNEIQRLPDTFGDLKELVYLDLSKNKLQALPLSMGKLTRLQYLRLSENPFRAPLKEFLGDKGRDVSPIALAELVVTFLKEMTVVHVTLSQSTLSSSTGRNWSSKVHYRKRSSKCVMAHYIDTDVKSSTSEGEEEMEVKESKSVGAQKSSEKNLAQSHFLSRKWTISDRTLLVILTLLAIFLLPIPIAYFIETSYFEDLAKRHPFWEKIWTNCYKSVHKLAAGTFNRKYGSHLIQGPPSSMISLTLDGFVEGFKDLFGFK